MSLLHIAGGATEDKLYVEDVFSTYLYTGNGSAQTINNGIDLAGKGGLVWIKNRKNATWNVLFDTARGINKYLTSNGTDASATYSQFNQTFTSNGFTLNTNESTVNASAGGDYYASWTFRKAPKFFDVVTYTGDGVAGRQIAHSLGVAPGMIIIKHTNAAGSRWAVWHRSVGGRLALNQTDAYDSSNTIMNGGAVIASSSSTFGGFEITNYTNLLAVNANGAAYVAYLFAHDPSADGIIQCGSFSENTTTTIGWEPQWLMIKRTDSTGDWITIDNMRGCSVGGIDAVLFPNLSNAESVANDYIDFTPTGFISKNLTGTYIYTVIRRPMKVPTSGTEVYNAIASSEATGTKKVVGFPIDLQINAPRTNGVFRFYDRLRSISSNSTETGKALLSSQASAEQAESGQRFWDNVSFEVPSSFSSTNMAYLNFKRAKGFMDIVCYTDTGVARAVNHNLGVVPELMIVKSRSGASNWYVYTESVGSGKTMYLQLTSVPLTSPTYWNNTSPTAPVFTAGTNSEINGAASTYVAYLFATLAGISKVGAYTGNGTSQTINCGFSTGARFILIKRTDATGDWYIWDTARGIVAANDPHLSLNTTAAEVTTDDSIDPASSGFIVNQVAATNINETSASYIFLAIA